MNEQYIRLSNILKSDPEVKELIEELKFGCWIKEFRNYEDDNIFTYRLSKPYNNVNELIKHIEIDTNKLLKIEIIGQIHTGLLLMYLNIKAIESFSISDTGSLWRDNHGVWQKILELNNSKDLMHQEESVYKSICDFLETL